MPHFYTKHMQWQTQQMPSCSTEDLSNIILTWFLNPIKSSHCQVWHLSPCFDATQSLSRTNKLFAPLLTAPAQWEVKTIFSEETSLSLSSWQMLSHCFCRCLQNVFGVFLLLLMLCFLGWCCVYCKQKKKKMLAINSRSWQLTCLSHVSPHSTSIVLHFLAGHSVFH